MQRVVLPINCDNRDLGFLGNGFVLYFELIKGCIYILLAMFLLSGMTSIVTNYFYGSDCVDSAEYLKLDETEQMKFCYKSWVTVQSMGNVSSRQDLLDAQQILNFVSTLILLVYFQFLRRRFRQWSQDSDEMDISPGDYTIWLKGVPPFESNKYTKVIKEFCSHKLIPGR